MREDLTHRASRLDDAIRRHPFPQQVVARERAVRKIDVADVVDDPTVYLLGHALVEASVACLHMEHWNAQPFRSDGRQTAVRITEYQQSVGPYLSHHCIRARYHLANRFGGSRRCRLQEMIRLSDLQIVKEYSVQLVVVVLASVNE